MRKPKKKDLEEALLHFFTKMKKENIKFSSFHLREEPK